MFKGIFGYNKTEAPTTDEIMERAAKKIKELEKEVADLKAEAQERKTQLEEAIEEAKDWKNQLGKTKKTLNGITKESGEWQRKHGELQNWILKATEKRREEESELEESWQANQDWENNLQERENSLAEEEQALAEEQAVFLEEKERLTLENSELVRCLLPLTVFLLISCLETANWS